MVVPKFSLGPESQAWGRYVTDLAKSAQATADRAETNIAAMGKQLTSAARTGSDSNTALSAQQVDDLLGRVTYSQAGTSDLTSITATAPTNVTYDQPLNFSVGQSRIVYIDCAIAANLYAESTTWAQFGLVLGLQVDGIEPTSPSDDMGVYLPDSFRMALTPPTGRYTSVDRNLRAIAVLALSPGSHTVNLLLKERSIVSAGASGELVRIRYSSAIKTVEVREAL